MLNLSLSLTPPPPPPTHSPPPTHLTQVTLIDQSERFTFKPLLYELLNGTASQAEVAPTFAQLLAPYPITFVQARVESVQPGDAGSGVQGVLFKVLGEGKCVLEEVKHSWRRVMVWVWVCLMSMVRESVAVCVFCRVGRHTYAHTLPPVSPHHPLPLHGGHTSLHPQLSPFFSQGGTVRLSNGTTLEYDWLVLALGSSVNTFGIPGVKEYALPFVTYDDAVKVG